MSRMERRASLPFRPAGSSYRAIASALNHARAWPRRTRFVSVFDMRHLLHASELRMWSTKLGQLQIDKEATVGGGGPRGAPGSSWKQSPGSTV